MSFRQDLFHLLRGTAKQEGAGLSWGFSRSEDKYPRIVLRLTGDTHEHHTRGPCNFAAADVQVTCYATKTQDRSPFHVADDVADAVARKMNGYYGLAGQTFIHSAELNERYQIEEEANAKGGWIVGVVLEFTISHGMSVQSAT